MKRGAISLVIRDIKTKTTGVHFSSIREGIFSKIPNTQLAEVREPGTLYFAGGNPQRGNFLRRSPGIIFDSAFRNLAFKYQSRYIRIHVHEF